MAADRYMKLVLTLIAVCLVWLSAGGPSLLTPVSAQADQRVIISGWVGGDGKVRQISPGGIEGQGLPVVVIQTMR